MFTVRLCDKATTIIKECEAVGRAGAGGGNEGARLKAEPGCLPHVANKKGN